MKDNKNITASEQSIKQMMQSAQQHVDNDMLWASIENRIPSQRKKRRGVVWFWAGLSSLLIAILITTMIGWNDTADVHVASTTSSIEAPTTYALLSSDDNNARVATDEQTDDRKSTDLLAKSTAQNVETSSTNSRVEEAKTTLEILNETEVESVVTSVARTTTNQAVIDSPTELSSSTSPTYNDNDQDQATQEDRSLLSPTSRLLTLAAQHLPIDLQVYIPNAYILRKESSPWIDEIVALGGLNLTSWSYSGPLRNVIGQQEVSLPSYQAQLLIKKQLKGGWSTGLSLGLRSAISRVQDSFESTDQDLVDGIASISISNGVKTETPGQVRRTTIYNNRNVLHRQQSYYTVGVDLYRDIISKPFFRVSTRLGGGLSLAAQPTGYAFSHEGNVVDGGATDLDYDRAAPYATGGLLVAYDLGSWSMLMSCDLHHRFGASVATSNYKIKNTQAGLSLGIAYRPTWDL